MAIQTNRNRQRCESEGETGKNDPRHWRAGSFLLRKRPFEREVNCGERQDRNCQAPAVVGPKQRPQSDKKGDRIDKDNPVFEKRKLAFATAAHYREGCEERKKQSRKKQRSSERITAVEIAVPSPEIDQRPDELNGREAFPIARSCERQHSGAEHRHVR